MEYNKIYVQNICTCNLKNEKLFFFSWKVRDEIEENEVGKLGPKLENFDWYFRT